MEDPEKGCAMDCPNPDCRRNLEDDICGLRRTVYGATGSNGLVGDLKEKVSRNSMWSIFLSTMGVLVAVLIAVGAAMVTVWADARDYRESKPMVLARERRITELEGQFKNLVDSQCRMERALETFRSEKAEEIRSWNGRMDALFMEIKKLQK
jgi:hypothetical protein